MILAKTDSLVSIIPPETVPILILLVSIVGFTIIIERLIFFSRWKSITPDDWRRVKDLLREKNYDSASDLMRSLSQGPVSQVLQAGITQFKKNASSVDDEILTQGLNQIQRMEKFLSPLATIATISPLLGVLGTVLGIIRSFAEGSGTRGAEVGISEALITTAMGLAVAIPAYIFHNFFQKKKEDAISEMESLSEQALRFLK
ncbi:MULTISPECIES: MotA/TolQ/ExbB proton channel family protein [Leptospira]|uniref:MotA/TolQ/ExbB proton channel family protein n=2 Tax=Leptospira TaxID=171 RepID=A0ABX4PI31_9LEPT|nr:MULTISPECIES: MotA/TolQ/ExbB proton channel family protein [Leptospira]EIE00230.1 transporter, MotA/TolQ/ExbB proton channel family protein [Leptospira licerasiae serovar Varillal str. VAR 010]EJZ41742.1 transporter, MotA/TolQ/ExbB proton channel family protein [Leptospira licerasiae str. MMD4847]PKA15425.1 MotA/TolQ/ExbB proton channel family protein [Leptospira haakeii]PKA18865.1 MotA/TolQ/ExbB proton channel family protein [Leptospira haakeii]TGM94534.1 MotA/TolQ/ExbB proton channel fami